MNTLRNLSAVLLCVSASVSSSSGAWAQDASTKQTPVPSTPPITSATSSDGIVKVTNLDNALPNGTALKLKLTQNLSSGTNKTGDRIPFEVVDEVDVNGVPVIAKGASALGTVTNAEPKKSMGRAGKLDVNIDSVRLIDGENAALGATRSEKGGSHTGAMAAGMVGAAIIFFPAAPFLLLVHGKDISIPEGTIVTAFTQGDTKLDITKFAAGPEVPGGTATASSLAVDSNVPNGDITIDGNFVGSTPSMVTVAPGQHTIVVSKKGFASWTRTMNVSGVSVHVSADLEAQPDPAPKQ